MLGLLQDILCVLQALANMVLWALVELVNLVVFSLAGFVNLTVALMPTMPDVPGALDGTVLDYVNWLFPVGGLVSIFAGFIALWAAWLLVRIPLRWAKVV